MTKKMNQLLRHWLIGERIFSWFNISPNSLTKRYGSCGRAGRIASMWFCFGLWSAWCSLESNLFVQMNLRLLNVYSRHATESVVCENSSESFVMKYCPTSTVGRKPASVQNFINLSCCDNFSIRSAGSSFKGMFVFITPGTNNGLACPFTTGLSVLSWQDSHSSHISATAP